MIKYLHVIVVLCLCLFKGFIKLFCGIENPWHRSWYGDYQKHRGYEGLKALVVEDNELNREIAPEILREYGFRVDTAEN